MRKAHVLLVFVHQFVFIRVGMRPLVGLRISCVRMVAKEAVLLLAVDFFGEVDSSVPFSAACSVFRCMKEAISAIEWLSMRPLIFLPGFGVSVKEYPLEFFDWFELHWEDLRVGRHCLCLKV